MASNATVTTRVGSILAVLAAAQAGDGLALLPCFIGAGAELQRLGPVRGWADVWMLVHPDLQQVSRVRAVIDGIAAMIAADAPMFTGASDRA